MGTTVASLTTASVDALEGDDVGILVSTAGIDIAYVPVPDSVMTPDPDLFVTKNPPLNANNNSINNNMGVLIFLFFSSGTSSGSSNPTVPLNALSGGD